MKKTAKIDAEIHEKLKALSAQYNRSIKELIGYMTRYFEQTGINPMAPPKKDVVQQVEKLRQQLIGFLRKQEKEQLKPMLAEMQMANDQMGGFAKGLAKERSLQLMQQRVEEQLIERPTRDDFELMVFEMHRRNRRQEALRLFNCYLEERQHLSAFASKEELNERYRTFFEEL